MTTKEKRESIKSLTIDMLIESHEAMLKKVDKALNSSAIDVEQWDENINPMILPKCIVTAILKRESGQYEAKGTSFEKEVKKRLKTYFILFNNLKQRQDEFK